MRDLRIFLVFLALSTGFWFLAALDEKYSNRRRGESVATTVRTVSKKKKSQAKVVEATPVEVVETEEAVEDEIVEKEVRVRIQTTNFPADKCLRTFPSQATVVFNVPQSEAGDVADEDFAIVITYEQILALQEANQDKIDLELRYLPKNVTVVRIEPSEVDYLLETVGEDAQ